MLNVDSILLFRCNRKRYNKSIARSGFSGQKPGFFLYFSSPNKIFRRNRVSLSLVLILLVAGIIYFFLEFLESIHDPSLKVQQLTAVQRLALKTSAMTSIQNLPREKGGEAVPTQSKPRAVRRRHRDIGLAVLILLSTGWYIQWAVRSELGNWYRPAAHSSNDRPASRLG